MGYKMGGGERGGGGEDGLLTIILDHHSMRSSALSNRHCKRNIYIYILYISLKMYPRYFIPEFQNFESVTGTGLKFKHFLIRVWSSQF